MSLTAAQIGEAARLSLERTQVRLDWLTREMGHAEDRRQGASTPAEYAKANYDYGTLRVKVVQATAQEAAWVAVAEHVRRGCWSDGLAAQVLTTWKSLDPRPQGSLDVSPLLWAEICHSSTSWTGPTLVHVTASSTLAVLDPDEFQVQAPDGTWVRFWVVPDTFPADRVVVYTHLRRLGLDREQALASSLDVLSDPSSPAGGHS